MTIDLTNADITVFDAYEAKVLTLLAKHGGRMEMRVRAVDGSQETHLLVFPDAEAFESYRANPYRLAIQDEWFRSAATSIAVEVRPMSDLV